MSTNISLASINSTQGFILPGEAPGDNSGYSVSNAGDFNKDGYGDVIIGAIDANAPAPNYVGPGKSYIVFGGPNITSSNLSLSTLSNTQGVAIMGANNGDQVGYSVSSAGDFNKDTYGDIIIGAPGASNVAGTSYVIFGGPQVGSMNITTLNNQGFSILGENSGDKSGFAVSSAGDMNGDGFADVIIGAPSASNGAGISYVVFGSSAPSSISLSALNNVLGFKILGEASSDNSGCSVSSAGDFNKDGYGDIIIGAKNAGIAAKSPGKSYVIFGGPNIGSSDISLSALNSTQGFKILGENTLDLSGYSVGSAGDFNKDGYGDVIIGAPKGNVAYGNTGTSYVIFGHGGTPADIDLSTLKNTNGFKILGANSGDQCGCSVGSAGDFNKDGYGDVIVGANVASSSPIANDYTGKSYIIFGHGGAASNVNLFTLNNQGIMILGGSQDEIGNSVNGAGDVNGDGYADVIIGASTAFVGAGESSVVLGGPHEVVQPPIQTSDSPLENGLSNILIIGLFTSLIEFA